MKKKNAVTLNDIAQKLDLNISTVSRALKDHPKISASTKEKVFKTAKELNYAPNNIAAALANGQSKVVGVIVPSIDESFFALTIHGIEKVLKQVGYQIIISQSDDSTENEKENISTLLKTQVDGILASHAMGTESFGHYQQILDREVPLILFDRFSESLDTHVVASDDFKGAYKAVEHLIQQGCQKIAHIGGEDHVHIYHERLRGYKEALADYDVPFDEQYVFQSNLKLEAGRAITGKIVEQTPLPDAIFAVSDYSAMGAIQVLKEHDICVPEDIAVVGYSNESFAPFVTPTLTSVDQHSVQIGAEAARSLLEQMDEDQAERMPRKTILPPKLIIRESSQKK